MLEREKGRMAKITSMVDALESGTGFPAFVRTVGRKSSTGNPLKVEHELMAPLLREGPSKRKRKRLSFKEAVTYFKCILGLGIYVAASRDASKQEDRLRRTLLRLAHNENSECSDEVSRLALCEIAFVDQYLSGRKGRGRKSLRETVYAEVAPLMEKDRWAPAIRDYLVGWQLTWAREDRSYKRLGKTRQKQNLVVVGSVKGGVGKSLIAAALTRYLAKKSRTLLIDLDFSGATAQYLFHIPSVSEALAAMPKGGRNGKTSPRWVYYTFSDVLPWPLDLVMSPSLSREERKSEAESLILHPKDAEAIGVCLLPDSPTYCALVSALTHKELDRDDFITGLEAVLDASADAKHSYKNVIIDLGPGLYGMNGPVLRWLSNQYSTQAIIVSSPRSCDLATSLYESAWLAAQGDFGWRKGKPILHLVNMLPAEQQISSGESDLPEQFACYVDDLANRCVMSAIRSNTLCDSGSMHTANQVYAWRMWTYLYLVGVPWAQHRLRLHVLPEEPKFRRIQNPMLEGRDDVQFVDSHSLVEDNEWFPYLRSAYEGAVDRKGDGRRGTK